MAGGRRRSSLLRKGDWNWGDWGEDIDMGVLTTCWYYLALKAEREFATMLGRREDAEKDTRMMEKIEKAFDGAYWTGSVFAPRNTRVQTMTGHKPWPWYRDWPLRTNTRP